MKKDSKIFIAGHSGNVGSSLLKALQNKGYANFILKTHAELDLSQQKAVREFFAAQKPEFIVLCAAKSAGMQVANAKRADFLYENLMIQNNVIRCALENGVKKLIFIASTTIYPKNCPQPIKESYLLDSKLEHNFECYAIAKIAGLKLCEACNAQHGTNFITVAPSSLYGTNDKFDLKNAQVLPALMRKMHLAKLLQNGDEKALLADINAFLSEKIHTLSEAREYLKGFNVSEKGVGVWGSGQARRDFLHCDDLSAALIHLLESVDYSHLGGLSHLNVGPGEDVSIKELALLIKAVVGFEGELIFDTSKPEGTLRKLVDISEISRLGFAPKISLESGVMGLYGHYLKAYGKP